MRVRSPALTAIAITSIALSACKAKDAEEAATAPAAEASKDSAGAAVDPAVAPGVAFQFDYAFVMPGDAISQAQREHAGACAKLGPSRCRVTGMNYSKERTAAVSARLDFLLAPDAAQAFAADGIAAVEKLEGKLDNALVQGENAGDAISLSQSESAAIEAEAKRIETRLAAPGLAAQERAELQRQLGELRNQLRGNVEQRRSLEHSIATTPVSFTYTSEGLVGSKGAFGKAAAASWSSLESLLAFLALIGGVALPWLALGGLGVFIWRRVRSKPVPLQPATTD